MTLSDPAYHSEAKTLPREDHFAVVYTDSVSIDSGYDEDRGSRSNILQYLSFSSETALKQWIKANNDQNDYSRKRDYRVIHVHSCDVDIIVDVKINVR